MSPRVLSAILFSPRGGSAHAARALARGLRNLGCVGDVAGRFHEATRASTVTRWRFYGDVRAVSSTPRWRATSRTDLRAPRRARHCIPHSRTGRRSRPRVRRARRSRVRAAGRRWSRALDRAGACDADVLHLHHLTPINEAAGSGRPRCAGRRAPAWHRTADARADRWPDPPEWPYAERWSRRMRGWAQRCARLVVAPGAVDRAASLLDVPARAGGHGLERCRHRPVHIATSDRAPSGGVSDRAAARLAARRGAGKRALPRGRCRALAAGVVLLYVGRFTAVKRLDRLISAFARVQEQSETPAGLVLVGGHPGEWEGEHPAASPRA